MKLWRGCFLIFAATKPVKKSNQIRSQKLSLSFQNVDDLKVKKRTRKRDNSFPCAVLEFKTTKMTPA
jgi:hypothetical protein